MNKKILLIIVLVGIVGTILFLEKMNPMVSRTDISSQKPISLGDTEKSRLFTSAKEITTPDGFINTEPFTLGDLIGEKIILLDFWTYSCINCQRTIPYLNLWHEKYKDDELVIVGLHTPEFEFEKEFENVKRAVEKFGITYPVVLDNDYSTWTDYKNRYWPRKYLIDIDGFIVYDHIGEGGYRETEEAIVKALNEKKERMKESSIVMKEGEVKAETPDFRKVKSPEMYLGYGRIEHITPVLKTTCLDTECAYEGVKELSLNDFSLDGTWRVGKESATLLGEGSIFLSFSASKVNLVLGSEKETRALVFLDGIKVKEFTIQPHDLYTLIDLEGQYGEHTLEVRFLDGGVEAFAFTFG